MGVQPVITVATGLAVALSAVLGAPISLAQAQPKPPGDRPGCYAKMATAPVYKTVVSHVGAAPVVTFRDTAPVTAHYRKRVLVSAARVESQSLPAVYKTVWRWSEVAGPEREASSPPVYRTVTERRLIAPAHLAWRPGGVAHGYAGPSDGGPADGGYGAQQARPTGEVLCRVLIPARYASTSRRVMISPGRHYTVRGAARHVHTAERVLVRPARTVEHRIAAVYRTEDAVRIVRPAGRRRIVTPGAATSVTRRVLVRPGHTTWAPIVCIPHPGDGSTRPMPQPAPRPAPRHVPAPGVGYGPVAPPAVNGGGGYGGGYGGPVARSGGRNYRPDEIVAPAPYPAYLAHMHMPPPPASAPGMSMQSQPLVPAPYDVGHPAR